MAVIIKKIQQDFFEAIVSGKKKYELRLNDFAIAEGDTLVLEEWDDGEPRKFTGRKIEKTVTYVGKCKIDELYWSKEEINAQEPPQNSLPAGNGYFSRPLRHRASTIWLYRLRPVAKVDRKNISFPASEYSFSEVP